MKDGRGNEKINNGLKEMMKREKEEWKIMEERLA